LEISLDSDLSEENLGFSSDSWQKKGFSLSNGKISDSLVEELRKRVERITDGEFELNREPPRYKSPYGANQSHIEMYSHVHWADSLINSIAMNRELAKQASKLLGIASVRLWGTSVIYKYGNQNSKNSVRWHRDKSFWQCVNNTKMMTFWIALDDTSPENGCLEFAISSHKKPFNPNEVSDLDLCNFKSQLAQMKKGEVSAHHSMTGHRSNCNTTSLPRRAITIHYMDSESQFVPGSGSDDHINVCLIGSLIKTPISGEYFPKVYDAQAGN